MRHIPSGFFRKWGCGGGGILKAMFYFIDEVLQQRHRRTQTVIRTKCSLRLGEVECSIQVECSWKWNVHAASVQFSPSPQRKNPLTKNWPTYQQMHNHDQVMSWWNAWYMFHDRSSVHRGVAGVGLFSSGSFRMNWGFAHSFHISVALVFVCVDCVSADDCAYLYINSSETLKCLCCNAGVIFFSCICFRCFKRSC